MNFIFSHHEKKDLKDERGKDQQVEFHNPPHSTTEGSEFLDDGIRMREQPLMRTEESVAVRSPLYFL